jgi:hypothetical protein
MKKEIYKLSLLVILFFPFFQIDGWGKNGHRIVAEAAEHYLTPKTKAYINKILSGKSMAQISIWADEMYSVKDWNCASTFHYANIEAGKKYLDSKKNPRGDIVRALIYFEDILRDQENSPELRLIALKYFIHFVGDIHQPLHAGLACDYGGNDIKINWFGRVTNLHVIWDETLIEFQQLSYTEFVKFLEHPSANLIKRWQNSTYLDWIEESRAYRKSVYICYKEDRCFLGNFYSSDCSGNEELKKNPARLKYQYNYRHFIEVEKRLLKAGIRLAGKLNSIFLNGRKISKIEKLSRKKILESSETKLNNIHTCIEGVLKKISKKK